MNGFMGGVEGCVDGPSASCHGNNAPVREHQHGVIPLQEGVQEDVRGHGTTMEFPGNLGSGTLQAPDEFYNVDDFFDTYLYELKKQNNPTVTSGTQLKDDTKRAHISDLDLFDGVNMTGQTDESGEPEASTEGNRQTGTKKKRQSQANKVAQQRYRERKKQKYMEMEKAVEDMKAELAYMQALKKRNSLLENMNTQLQAQMIEKESEIEKLKANMDAQSDASLVKAIDRSDQEEGVTLSGTGGKPERKGCVVCNVLPKDLSGIDFKTGFEDQIQVLRKFMEDHGISFSGSSKDAELATDTLNELALHVGRSCQLCQAAIRAEGVQVLNLINGNVEKWKKKGGDPRWMKVLNDIQLTENQKRDMLLLRTSHLEKMKEIYSERQQLNLDAISKMLPHSSDEPENDMTIDGRMHSMSSGTYLPLARRNAQLNEILDRVKQNLRKEQRAMMDLNCFTISNIMTPLQSARYMVGVYPMHCDALALSNALARSESATSSKGNEDQTPP